MKFKVKTANLNHDAANLPHTGDNAPFVYIQPHDWYPMIYLPATLGGYAFFDRVELSINGRPVEGPQLSTSGFIFQHVNRRFTTDDIRKEKYADPFLHTPAFTHERAIGGALGAVGARGANISPEMKKLSNTLQFDTKGTSRSKVASFSFDGVPLLSAQTNLSRSMMQTKVENPYIPPNTKITITLHKRVPLDALFEIPQITDAEYWVPAVSTIPRVAVQVEFSEIVIVYESKLLTSKTEVADAKKTHTFADCPDVHYQTLREGQMETTNIVEVAAGSKYIILCWFSQQQVFYNTASNKNLSCRLRYPPGSTGLKLTLKGHLLPMLFKNGLVDLGVAGASSSITCEAYWQWLVRHSLYEKSKSHLFPATERGYEQVVIVPLHHLNIPEKTSLQVEMTYNDATSLPGWFLWSCCVSQWKYKYEEEGPMRGAVCI